MGSFRDLPKDVVWLIIRQVILNDNRKTFPGLDSRYFETLPFMTLTGMCGHLTSQLARVSRQCLNVIRSKCHRIGVGFIFNKGSFSL